MKTISKLDEPDKAIPPEKRSFYNSVALTVDPEFKAIIPLLTGDEWRQLEANLVADGCRDPLVVWDSPAGLVLLDGHTRWAICREHDIPFDVVVPARINGRADAKMFIALNQLGRRNLNAYQKARLALIGKNEIAARAKEKQRSGGIRKVPQISAEPIETRQKIAEAAGVSHNTIAKVGKIEALADDATKRALERGEMSINEAFQQVQRADDRKKRTVPPSDNGELPDLPDQPRGKPQIKIIRTALGEGAERFKLLINEIQRLRKQVKTLSETRNAGEYLPLSTADADLKNAIGTLKYSMPYARCYACAMSEGRQAGCQLCGGRGWISRGLDSQGPPELREAAKRTELTSEHNGRNV